MPLRLSLLCLGLLLAGCGKGRPGSSPVQYTEITRQAGIDFVHYNGAQGEYYYPETYGSGAAFLDYDDDGWQDLYLVNGAHLSGVRPDPPPVNHLYRNTGDGTFVDVTAASGAGDPGYGTGCAAADYDDDGDQDIYVTNFGPNALYRNDGNGHFTDVAAAMGVADPRWGSSCGFLDYDLDGDLDLFVANYVDFSLDHNPVCRQGAVRSYCDPSVFEPTRSILYRNDGEHFTDVTQAAGITGEGRGLGVAFSDYDQDGDTDIYVANDGSMNFLYQNQGGRFDQVALQAGAGFGEDGRAMAGMGVDFGDYDDDGDQDIYVTNFSREPNTLYQNQGNGQFIDVTARLGLVEPSYLPLGFSAKFLDYDDDADLDIFVGNGHIMDRIAQVDPALSYAQRNQMMRNDGGTRFTDVSSTLGPSFAVENVARGTAVADYDNDGDLDLLVTTVADRPRLLRNDGGNQGHWLLIQLVGTHPRDAIGTRVMVAAGGKQQLRERQSGSSYLSSHDPRLHFGLGQSTRADLEVRWPDGQTQVFEEVAADQILRLVQPGR